MASRKWSFRKRERSRTAAQRWARRGAATVVLLGLCGLMYWLLAEPFAHPRTRLVLLTGDAVTPTAHLLTAPQADYVFNDFRELVTLRPVLHDPDSGQNPIPLGNLRNREEMREVGELLRTSSAGRRDVLIVYVAAQCFSEDGDAWLQCTNDDPQNGIAGRYRLANFLSQVAENDAAVKLIVLEAGRTNYDPQRGLLENRFMAMLRDQVQHLNDPRLWVLTSHSGGERSNLSHALERTVFGYFTALGMQGGADFNHDGDLTLQELTGYVSANVSQWVQQSSGALASQTPMLVWGGGVELRRAPNPVLLSVERRAEVPAALTPRETLAVKKADRKNRDPLTARARLEADDFLNRQITRVTPGGTFGGAVGDRLREIFDQLSGGSEEEAPPADAAQAAPTAADGVAAAGTADAAKEGATPTAKPGDIAAKEPAKSSKADAPTPPTAQTPAPGADTAAAAGATSDAEALAALQENEQNRQRIATLLENLWNQHDQLASSTNQSIRPLDAAQPWWLAIEKQLLTLEQRSRTGRVADVEAFASMLERQAKRMAELSNAAASPKLDAATLEGQIAQIIGGPTWVSSENTTAALLELRSQQLRQHLPKVWAAKIAELDRLATGPSATAFFAWGAALTADDDRLDELAFARRVAAREAPDWPVMQMLLQTHRLSGQAAAATLDAPGWIGERILAADEARLRAESQFLDATRLDRAAVMASATSARDQYLDCLADLQSVAEAHRLHNDLYARSGWYLQWYAAACGRTETACPSAAQLQSLQEQLSELGRLLDEPRPDHPPAIRKVAAELKRLQGSIEAPLSVSGIEGMLSSSATAGDIHRLELMLETPLVPAPLRSLLWTTVVDLEAEQIARWTAPPPSNAALFEAASAATPGLGKSLVVLQQSALNGACATVDQQIPELAALNAAATTAMEVNVRQAARSEQSPTTAAEAVSSSLKEFYRRLAASVETAVELQRILAEERSQRSSAVSALRGLDRTSRLGNAFNGQWNAALAPHDALANAQLFDLLVWQQQRVEAASQRVSPATAKLLLDQATDLRQLAGKIPFQPQLAQSGRSPLQVDGPTAISLDYDREQNVDLTVRNLVSEETPVWLLVDADPALISVRGGSDTPIYPLPGDLLPGIKPSDLVKSFIDLQPTLTLRGSAPEIVHLQIRRVAPARRPSRVIVHVVTESHVVRRQIDVTLPPPPVAEVFVVGQPGTSTIEDLGLSLHPFPNRVTPFGMQLRATDERPRTLDLQLYALSGDEIADWADAAYSPENAERLQTELHLGPLLAVAKGIQLDPTKGPAPVLWVAPPPPVAAAPPTAASPATTTGEPPAAKPATASKPLLNNGLVIAMHDAASKLTAFRRIDLSVQRPQRYVRARVRFNLAQSRIEVEVAAQDPAAMPAEGVDVRCEVLQPLPADAERRLTGRLTAPNWQTTCYIEAPRESQQTYTVQIDIDGYPRGFTFQVPTNRQSLELPEDVDRLAVRATLPTTTTVFGPETRSLPVRVAVDAPPQSPTAPLRVAVGLDLDRDRTFSNEEPLILTTDRDVKITLDSLGEDGALLLAASVDDLLVQLPVPTQLSTRANVLARATVGDLAAWSEPVEVVFDALPPRVKSIELRPDTAVPQGAELELSLAVDDQQLSGAARVEALVDVSRSGAFGPMAAPVPAAENADGRWIAKIPTAEVPAGNYNLLVRATDRAGNVSEPQRVKVQLLSATESAEIESEKNTGTIEGAIMFGADPLGDAKVVLFKDAAPVPPPPPGRGKAKARRLPPPNPEDQVSEALTNSAGQFRFKKIPAGSYRIVAAALVHNKNRRVDASVTLAPPKRLEPLQLKLQ